ncbi:MAG: helix-turn-helix transcriptional regulator [Nitrososphaerales archaeon]
MGSISREEDLLLDLTSKVYKLVIEHGGVGVLQSELWKELTLTSRDGSRLAIRLERRGMIRREKVLDDGRWTYKLTPLRLPVQIRSIEQVPCITCPYESKCSLTGVVSPLSCPWVSEWVLKDYRESVGEQQQQQQVQPTSQQPPQMKRVAEATAR